MAVPGIEARWTHGNKTGIGTAYSAFQSPVVHDLERNRYRGLLYPTVDRPQASLFLQYLVSDGKTFFHEEKRDLTIKTERISDHALGYRCINADPAGRYSITKEIISDPHLPCLLQRTRISCDDKGLFSTLKFLFSARLIWRWAEEATMVTSPWRMASAY